MSQNTCSASIAHCFKLAGPGAGSSSALPSLSAPSHSPRCPSKATDSAVHGLRERATYCDEWLDIFLSSSSFSACILKLAPFCIGG